MTTSSVATSPTTATGAASSANTNSSLGATSSAQEQSDRFLKLLVAQMQNQDPLNPMDSAQVTSQMAQISTVQGVQALNATVGGLSSQFTQLQTMQGAALVGHDVATEGNGLRVDATTGKGDGGFEISSAATSVKVDIVNAAGQTIGTVDMGAQSAGRHSFSYDVPTALRGQSLSFKVTAMAQATPVDTLSLAYSKINAVSTLNGQVALELNNGQRVAYDAVWAFL